MCIYANAFRKLPGYALIGACALIRSNMVHENLFKGFLSRLDTNQADSRKQFSKYVHYALVICPGTELLG